MRIIGKKHIVELTRGISAKVAPKQNNIGKRPLSIVERKNLLATIGEFLGNFIASCLADSPNKTKKISPTFIAKKCRENLEKGLEAIKETKNYERFSNPDQGFFSDARNNGIMNSLRNSKNLPRGAREAFHKAVSRSFLNAMVNTDHYKMMWSKDKYPGSLRDLYNAINTNKLPINMVSPKTKTDLYNYIIDNRSLTPVDIETWKNVLAVPRPIGKPSKEVKAATAFFADLD